MSIGRTHAANLEFQRLFSHGTVVGLTDGQLLERFASRGGPATETAFEALVSRHGPMVLRVCRGVLDDPHDARDAFQATFLVLVRRARSIRRQDSVASWLHGVARRVASRAKTDLARRRAHERRVAAMSPEGSDGVVDRDDLRVLHEEIGWLPAKFRDPIVLCYLEGLSYGMAAGRLGLSEPAVRGRLARARERLRSRLTRRGVTFPAGLALAGLTWGPAEAASLPALISPIVRAAITMPPVEGMGDFGTISTSVDALTKGVLRAMYLNKLRLIGSVLGVIVLVTAGIGSLMRKASGDLQGAAGQRGDTPRRKAVDRAEWASIRNNLKRIGIALHNYHQVHGQFPPPAVLGMDGKPLLSWRVAILPYLSIHEDSPPEETGDDLFKQFRTDEPWDSPHNKQLLARRPATYASPGSGAEDPSLTYYRGFLGRGAAFDDGRGGQGVSLDDVPDGAASTLMFAEAGEPVPWTKPDELNYAPDRPVPPLGGVSEEGFAAAFMSGHVRFLGRGIEERTLRALITRDGGERVVPDELPQVRLPQPNGRPDGAPKSSLEKSRHRVSNPREEEYAGVKDLAGAVNILKTRLTEDGKGEYGGGQQ